MKRRGRLAALGILLAGCATTPAGPRAADTPGPRIAHTMAFDPVSGQVLLFGGNGADGASLGDTWGWNGRAWRRLAGSGPPPRRWAAMAFDEERRRIVLFGGRDGTGRGGASLADTWEWDGRAWSRSADQGPAGRDHHTLTWDVARRQLVLFGGWDGTDVRGDTWLRDAGAWRLANTEGPPPRAAHGAAFDAADGTVVLYGGRGLDVFRDDVWRWDGRRWMAGAAGPGRRSFHGMAWDGTAGRVVVFGGREGDARFDDTWSLASGGWQREEGPAPAPRLVYAMAWDAPRRQLVVHGGGHIAEESTRWQLTDETWTRGEGGWRRAR